MNEWIMWGLIVGGLAVFFFGGKAVLSWAKTLGKAKKEFDTATKE